MAKRLGVAAILMAASMLPAAAGRAATEEFPTRLPDTVAPQIGCWFWTDDDLKPDGWRPFLDMATAHTSWTLLTTSIRIPRVEVTDADLHDRIKSAAEYARARGIGVVMDLDVRLARAAFQKKHPDELQEMLRLREVELRDAGSAFLAIASDTPSDHYTFRATPYVPLVGRLVRVYSYVRGPQGIDPATVQDITAESDLREAGPKRVAVSIPCSEKTAGGHAARRACHTVAHGRRRAPSPGRSGQPGARIELTVTFEAGRRHLPVVTLRVYPPSLLAGVA